MAFNAAGSVAVPLRVFGGLVSEMAPPDLPEGVSPDNGDVVFAPGSVSSRPGLQKHYASGQFPSGTSILWCKTFVNFAGDVENLFLCSNGELLWEDFSNNPGNLFLLYQAPVGVKAKSVTAFGREYIAFTDGLHGRDRPIQWDGNLLRWVTVDGPGSPPVVASIALPSVAMLATGTPSTVALTECDPAGGPSGGPYSQINCFTNTDITALVFVGSVISISGNTSSPMNVTKASVVAVYPNPGGLALFVLSHYLAPGTAFGTGGTATIFSGITMSRANNIVTVETNGAHQLLPGYQAQITGVAQAAVGGGISSITIDNEDLPGIATVTTASAHGLVPNINVILAGITPAVVGGTISAIVRAGDIVTCTTSSAHGLSPGAIVTLAGVTDTSFDTTVVVAQVISATVFTFSQVDADASSSGGTVSLNWPIAQTNTPNLFTVQSVPTATTFQVSINYSDGTWGAGGTVSYAWDGTFFVLAVPNSSTFTYQQYGPNATSTSVGTVTPYGQAAPGIHQCQVAFLTPAGYLTRPSPPVKFVANGGQYISVSNIAYSPYPDQQVVLLFTAAGGNQFFYIPVPAQVNGQIVSTATVIQNTITGVILDFSDNTLLAATGVNIPGNNIPNQVVLDKPIAFGFFNQRLIAWGMENRIQNLLNMMFDGGFLPASQSLPTGWTPHLGNQGGLLVGNPQGIGVAWQTDGSGGSIQQSAFEDAYGAPILEVNTSYIFNAWVQGSGTLTAKLLSSSTGFTSTAVLNATSTGSYQAATFSLETPDAIPPDMILTITGAASVIVANMSIIFAQEPFISNALYASYVDNPEAMDGVSGFFGPANDPHKVMDLGIIRNSLYLFTQDPGGRIHAVTDNGITEPAGWTVNEVAANCGVLSIWCLVKSQADDSSASGGEEWLAWASSSGVRIFDGSVPWKISQEIQTDWTFINAAQSYPPPVLGIWGLNDPVGRTLYFGVPTASITTPNLVLVMNYRELDTAYQIATSPPFHPSFSGHLIATDNTRKWTRWHLALYYGALMNFGSAAALTICFTPVPGNANVYTLNPLKLTDDDFGQIAPYYTTYFCPGALQEQGLRDDKGVPLGSVRKLLCYLTAFVSGTGNAEFTVHADSLSNPWSTSVYPLSANPTHDIEVIGGNAYAHRFAITLATVPATGTDNGFSLQILTMFLRAAKRMPVRGSV